MKKNVLTTVFICLLIGCFAVGVSAESLNWYCVREKNHKTPKPPFEFSFISESDGYSVDMKHADYSDEDRVIYLTFDAGYENGNIEKILDVLKEEEVPAAFFVLGNLIGKNTELVMRMEDEGHLVCNHTFIHKNMSLLNEKEFRDEIMHLESFYKEKTGRELAKFYRPPEGSFSRENLVWAKDMGYKTVFWSFAYMDWDNQKQPSREYAMNKIKENLHNGEIMLLHPTSKTNAEIMKEMIEYIKGEGFRFASLEDLS